MLDFLFNICFAPFHNAIKGGRLGALFSLTPSLTFTLAGVVNILFYKTVGRITLIFSPFILSLSMLLLFVAIYFLLDRIYIKNNRTLSKMRFPFLYGLLLLPFFLGSIIFFVFTVGRFG